MSCVTCLVSSCLQDVAGIGSAKTEALEIVECLMAPARCIGSFLTDGRMEICTDSLQVCKLGGALPQRLASHRTAWVWKDAPLACLFCCGELLSWVISSVFGLFVDFVVPASPLNTLRQFWLCFQIFSLPLRRRSFLHCMQPSAAFIAVCCQDPESQASCKSHCINSSCALPGEVWPMTKHQSPGFSQVPTSQAKLPWSFISVWF